LEYFPHVDLLLRALHITRARLLGSSRVAIDARLLRALVQAAVAATRFDPEFYQTTYPDIAEAVNAGQVPDLHRHFIEAGYFEGRLGAAPQVDEEYYLSTNRDVAAAVKRGDVPSGTEHYVRAGAAEGRAPSAAMKAEVERWAALLSEAEERRF
jgi:hypothetical protein